MIENHEFNAATVDEAVAKASRKLGIRESDLSYEVIDEGSSGFLGIGARDARISVNSVGAEETDLETPYPRDEPDEDYEQEMEAGISPGADNQPTSLEQTASSDLTAPEDLLSEIEEFAARAIAGMGFEARISVYDAGEFVALDVSPGDTGLFIGQKGETIDALQHLLNISVYKDREFVKRVVIDSEGYRQRRIEAVQGMAHRMARRATREGRTIELPPMNSAERRVVHMYLKENPEVSTDSEGTGDNRRVNIIPTR